MSLEKTFLFLLFPPIGEETKIRLAESEISGTRNVDLFFAGALQSPAR
jgi:hypothetical protein